MKQAGKYGIITDTRQQAGFSAERMNTMAKEKKVEAITDMEVDFAQWFADVCIKAELVDYSGV